MILTFILAIVASTICYVVWTKETQNIKNPDKWQHERINSYIAITVCAFMFIFIHSLVIGMSYDKYLQDRAFFSATKEQYHSAITVYENHATINMNRASFTDLKYQGYQENIGKFVSDLRNNIINYNESIVKKRVMGDNLFLNWFIVEPDNDMVIIKMLTE